MGNEDTVPIENKSSQTFQYDQFYSQLVVISVAFYTVYKIYKLLVVLAFISSLQF